MSSPAANLASMDPVAALRRIGFLLERVPDHPPIGCKAFRKAALTLAAMDPGEIENAVRTGPSTTCRHRTQDLRRSSNRRWTARCPTTWSTSKRLRPAGRRGRGDPGGAARGLHSHSNWSDGGSPIEEMAITAVELGHEYQALTDHSPRLTVANGLSVERLGKQLDIVERP